MATWGQVEHAFENIKQELGNPPVKLLTQSDYAMATGKPLGNFLGRIHIKKRLMTLRYRDRELYQVKKTIYHELAHVLFPHKPHWWIECFADKMVGSKTRGRYALKYGHGVEELPPRTQLISLAQEVSR